MVDDPRPQSFGLHWASPEADFRYWSKVAFWSLDESIALLLGKSPSGVSWRSVCAFVRISDFAREYKRLRDLAWESDAMNGGRASVPATEVLKWAADMGIAVPSGLLAAMEARQAKRLRTGNAQRMADPIKEMMPRATEIPPHAEVESTGAEILGTPPSLPQERGAIGTPPLLAETAQQRRDRLRERQAELKTQGVKEVRQRLAAEEGVSPKRLRAILKKSKPLAE
jgi:hypothetical protein